MLLTVSFDGPKSTFAPFSKARVRRHDAFTFSSSVNSRSSRISQSVAAWSKSTSESDERGCSSDDDDDDDDDDGITLSAVSAA